MTTERQTDALVELGRKLEHGFDLVTRGLSTRYGQPVDTIEVTDRSYGADEISVDATVHVNGAAEDLTVRAYDGGHEVVYHN
ncbi:MAG: hypothetical protein SVY41_01575 [Candidatus Nanohaloarchaea archaeon]|nr:hypothetical protein [Candidatus Nanohaloarchaea archaeon]